MNNDESKCAKNEQESNNFKSVESKIIEKIIYLTDK